MSTDRFILLTTGEVTRNATNGSTHYTEIVINSRYVASLQPSKQQLMVSDGYRAVHGTVIILVNGHTVWVQEEFNAVVDLVCGPDGELEMLNDDDPPTFGSRMNGNDPQN